MRRPIRYLRPPRIQHFEDGGSDNSSPSSDGSYSGWSDSASFSDFGTSWGDTTTSGNWSDSASWSDPGGAFNDASNFQSPDGTSFQSSPDTGTSFFNDSAFNDASNFQSPVDTGTSFFNDSAFNNASNFYSPSDSGTSFFSDTAFNDPSNFQSPTDTGTSFFNDTAFNDPSSFYDSGNYSPSFDTYSGAPYAYDYSSPGYDTYTGAPYADMSAPYAADPYSTENANPWSDIVAARDLEAPQLAAQNAWQDAVEGAQRGFTPDQRGLQPQEALPPEYQPAAPYVVPTAPPEAPSRAPEAPPQAREEAQPPGRYHGPTTAEDPLYTQDPFADVPLSPDEVGFQPPSSPPQATEATEPAAPTGGPTATPTGQPGDTRGPADVGAPIGLGDRGGGPGLYPGGSFDTSYPGGSPSYAPSVDLGPSPGGAYPGFAGNAPEYQGPLAGPDVVGNRGDLELPSFFTDTGQRGTELFEAPSRGSAQAPLSGNIPTTGAPSLQGPISGFQGPLSYVGPQSRSGGTTLADMLGRLGNFFNPFSQAQASTLPSIGGRAPGDAGPPTSPTTPDIPVPFVALPRRGRDRGQQGRRNEPNVPGAPKIGSPDRATPGQLQQKLQEQRTSQAQELSDKPGLKEALFKRAFTEVGHQGPAAIQAWLESVLNRANAEARFGRTLEGLLKGEYNDHPGGRAFSANQRGYFPGTGGPNSWTMNPNNKEFQRNAQNEQEYDRNNTFQQIAPLYDQLLNNALRGSNTALLSTGNASKGTGVGIFQTSKGGEKFGIETYKGATDWARSTLQSPYGGPLAGPDVVAQGRAGAPSALTAVPEPAAPPSSPPFISLPPAEFLTPGMTTFEGGRFAPVDIAPMTSFRGQEFAPPEALQGYPVAPVERGALPDIPAPLQGYPVASVERGPPLADVTASPGWFAAQQMMGRGPAEAFPDVATPGWQAAQQQQGVTSGVFTNPGDVAAQMLHDVGAPPGVQQSVSTAVEVAQDHNLTIAETAQVTYQAAKDAGATEAQAQTAAQVAAEVAAERGAPETVEARDAREAQQAYQTWSIPFNTTPYASKGGPGIVENDEIIGPPMSLAAPYPGPENVGPPLSLQAPYPGPENVGPPMSLAPPFAGPTEYAGPFAGPDVIGERGAPQEIAGPAPGWTGLSLAGVPQAEFGRGPSQAQIQSALRGPPDFERNAREMLAQVPAQYLAQTKSLLESLTPAEKSAIVSGRTALIDIVAGKYGVSRGTLETLAPKGALEGIARAQEALTAPNFAGRTGFAAPSIDIADMRGVTTGFPDEAIPTTAVPEPPSVPTQTAPPSVPETTPSVPQADEPVSPTPPAAPDLPSVTPQQAQQVMQEYPVEVAQISQLYGVDGNDAVRILLWMMLNDEEDFAEGGRVEEPDERLYWLKRGKGGDDFGRWPRGPTPDYPGYYAGYGRELVRRAREEHDRYVADPLKAMRLRLREENWERMLRETPRSSNIEDRREFDPTREEGGRVDYPQADEDWGAAVDEGFPVEPEDEGISERGARHRALWEWSRPDPRMSFPSRQIKPPPGYGSTPRRLEFRGPITYYESDAEPGIYQDGGAAGW